MPNTMKGLGVVIVEEYPKAVGSIYSMLSEKTPGVKISGCAESVERACEVMAGVAFDAVFLDMDVIGDDVDGALESMEAFCADKGLVAVSHTKSHAFDSFRFPAVDYLLKPLTFKEVVRALDRSEKLKKGVVSVNGGFGISGPISIVAIPSISEVKILRVDDIAYLKSDGRYTVFYTVREETIVSSKHLGYYEKLLAMNPNFFRIHHSYIVNVDLAVNVYKKDGVYLEIQNKKYLPISKRKTESFYKFLGI